MRATSPWGLPEDLLAPDKTQTDPVHGDVYWTKLERQLIDTDPMQRLRHVKQLGATLKVYPSAEHSRFTHLLGTLATAQQILDKVYAASEGPHSVPSLLREWRDQDDFEIRWAEATVLARLSALLHDLTHVPYGHTIEDDLQVLTPHDQNEARFQALWELIPKNIRRPIEDGQTQRSTAGRESSLFIELKAIILDKVQHSAAPGTKSLRSSYPFVADVVNNTICADLLDYIARDHYHLGLPFAVGDRFMDNFFIVPSYVKSSYAEHLVLRLVRDGEARLDVRTEVLKFLRYRYEETERALYHKTKLAYDAMLGKMLEMWKDALFYEEVCKRFPRYRKDPRSLDATWLQGNLALKPAGDGDGTSLVDTFNSAVQIEVERHFQFFGDEGLLEHLIWELQALPARDDRQEGILELCRRIRYRNHFRLIGQASGASVLGVAQEKYDAFRTAQARRDLEKRAAQYARIRPAWNVVLWIPSPKMRLKIAEVLVQQEDGLIRRLARALPDDTDHAAGDEDAALIVQRHMQLWALRIYAPLELRDQAETGLDADRNKADRLLGYMSHQLGIPLTRWDGTLVRPLHVQAAEELGDERKWTEAQRRHAAETLEDRAARTDFDTFEDLKNSWGDEDPAK